MRKNTTHRERRHGDKYSMKINRISEIKTHAKQTKETVAVYTRSRIVFIIEYKYKQGGVCFFAGSYCWNLFCLTIKNESTKNVNEYLKLRKLKIYLKKISFYQGRNKQTVRYYETETEKNETQQ